MKYILFLTVFACFLALSCNSTVDSLGDENLNIKTKNSAVILSNKSEKVIYYVLMESELATRVDIHPDFTSWPSIKAGAKITIPYSEIMGYEKSSKEAWITWQMEGGGSGGSLNFKL